MSAKGLEPLTNGLKGHCSTIELRTQNGEHCITTSPERQRLFAPFPQFHRASYNQKMEPLSKITPAWMSSNQPVLGTCWAGNSLLALIKRSDGSTLIRYEPDGTFVELPIPQKIRASLFYGGGDFTANENIIIYVDSGGQLFRLNSYGSIPVQLTNHTGKSAAPTIAADQRGLVFVHSDGSTDSLRWLDLSQPNAEPSILCSSADFYMQPAYHPTIDRLAWVEWDQPQMPWQGSRLMTGLLVDGALQEIQWLEGDEHTPVFQPEFSPDGRWLTYITTRGEWDDLVLLDLHNWTSRSLLGDTTLMEPAWLQGMRTYAWLPDSSGLLQITNQEGINHLLKVELEGPVTPIDLAPFTSLSQIGISSDCKRIHLVASSTRLPPQLIWIYARQIETLHHSYAQPVLPEILTDAQPVKWPGPEGDVYGLYYPPNPTIPLESSLPPAILHVHSGPTRQVDSGFSADTAFFTSCGYAVLSVNYHGSTGYGRSYRDALNFRWGDLDVLDTRAAVDFLVQNHLADPNRIIIKGSSAGGYTVLNALIRYPSVFRAGICAYGVSNLLSIVDETFKFEAHYYDSLIGPLPQDIEKYMDWSPIQHADQIRDPLAVFQGSEDIVVPPSQAEQLVQALTNTGTPHLYRIFDGEGHGWRKAETLASYYQLIEQFLQQYVQTR
jgi:dipeptidyl aminopeptidase/acylaminoacyl peptidase